MNTFSIHGITSDVADFSGKNDTVIGTKVPETMKTRLESIAAEEDRTVSYVIRQLIIRGLSLYEMDGNLRGEAPAKAMRQLAPVVARIERGEISKQDVQRMIDSQDIKPRRTTRIPVGGKVR